jgi:hypothetical protein
MSAMPIWANSLDTTNSSSTASTATPNSEISAPSSEVAGTSSNSEVTGTSASSGTASTGSLPSTSPLPSSSPSQILNSGQTGIIQLNNSGFSGLSQPSCSSSACVNGMVRMVPTNGGISGEATLGITWRLGGAPEDKQMEVQRQLVKTQSENLERESTLSLSEKLAEAIEHQKYERATLLAMMLAPRLGYKDHLQLLRQLEANRSSRQVQPGQTLAVFGKSDR